MRLKRNRADSLKIKKPFNRNLLNKNRKSDKKSILLLKKKKKKNSRKVGLFRNKKAWISKNR